MVTKMQATVAFLPMSGSIRSLTILLLGLLLTQTGCVALNIPSQRLHDPEDRGGLLGHWKDAKHRQPDWVTKFPGMDPEAVERAAAEGTRAVVMSNEAPGVSEFHGGESCVDCESDSYDPLASASGPPQPDVPWPKYHPVPTRAVFGVPVPQ